MMITTKLYSRYQTVIPLEIRKKLQIDPNSLVNWVINENGKVELSFEKKISEKDLVGLIKEELPYSSVEIKKRSGMGLKWKK
jgi:bifunctional DNA-binding transcriptional regulator/antitoxin component of YhaV-PrlF toxin-antitoxin module